MPPEKDERAVLLDLQEFAREVVTFTNGRTRQDLDTDRALHAAVPWKAMVGMRNIIAHEYGRVNLDQIGGRRIVICRPSFRRWKRSSPDWRHHDDVGQDERGCSFHRKNVARRYPCTCRLAPDPGPAPMIGNLALATVMVGLTVVIHFAGLLALMWVLRARGHRFRAHESAVGQGALVVFVVLGLVAIHTAEIWLYAVAYILAGALPDFESALYFSTTSFTTIGYGDVVLEKRWRLFGAVEGANGLLLFGWSTAFLISVTGRMRALEHDWLEQGGSR